MDAELEEIGRGHFGKKRYNTEGSVREVIRKCEQKRGQPLRYYSCLLCGGYHIAKVKGW